jgi:hypothetical protein
VDVTETSEDHAHSCLQVCRRGGWANMAFFCIQTKKKAILCWESVICCRLTMDDENPNLLEKNDAARWCCTHVHNWNVCVCVCIRKEEESTNVKQYSQTLMVCQWYHHERLFIGRFCLCASTAKTLVHSDTHAFLSCICRHMSTQRKKSHTHTHNALYTEHVHQHACVWSECEVSVWDYDVLVRACWLLIYMCDFFHFFKWMKKHV